MSFMKCYLFLIILIESNNLNQLKLKLIHSLNKKKMVTRIVLQWNSMYQAVVTTHTTKNMGDLTVQFIKTAKGMACLQETLTSVKTVVAIETQAGKDIIRKWREGL